MANDPRAFRVEMYEEHLEEASFLHEQRLGLLEDPELSWTDLHPFEGRLEAHLDALVVGGELALAVCRRRAVDGDAGELRAALTAFSRAGTAQDLIPALATLESADDERMRAAFEGLRLEMPEDWRELLAACGAPGSAAGLVLLAQVAADRGWDPGAAVRASLQDGPTRLRIAALRALGAGPRTAPRASPRTEPRAEAGVETGADDRAAVAALLDDPDPGTGREAARALLRMGRGDALDWLRRRAPDDPESAILLALGADRRSAVTLLQTMQSDPGRAEAPLVLGLLGDPAAVPWLLGRVAEEAAAAPAAEALWMITGAPIFEEKTRRPAADPERWAAWWQAESSRFRPGSRHLLGTPATAVGLLAALDAPDAPHRLRRLLWDQAVIRYGLRAAFAADWPVGLQLQALREMSPQARTIDARLAPGEWTFAGEA